MRLSLRSFSALAVLATLAILLTHHPAAERIPGIDLATAVALDTGPVFVVKVDADPQVAAVAPDSGTVAEKAMPGARSIDGMSTRPTVELVAAWRHRAHATRERLRPTST